VGWRLFLVHESATSALTDAHDPVAAAVELTHLRAAAVGEANPSRLDDVEVADGPAHAADAALVSSVDPGRTAGLAADVRHAWLVDDDGTRGSTTDVAVTTAMSTASGVAAPRTVVLGLRWTDDGWRVWDVTQPTG